MTIDQTLAQIMAELRTNRSEHEAIRAEMATKDDTAAIRAEMATKDDIAAIRAEMATKSDLAAEIDALRQEMATKAELGEIARALRKLGLDFETFRHDSKVSLDALSELMARTGRHDRAIGHLNRRTSRLENHLKLRRLPEPAGDQ